MLCFLAAAPMLRQTRTIPLPSVSGRIDHLAIDPARQRLFIAALGNNTLEVVDLAAGKRTQRATGLHEPQGIAYAPDSNRLFVANGKDGRVRIFDALTLQEAAPAITYDGDADNVRYDPAAKRIYVGYGDGAIGFIDAGSAKRIADVSVRAHPESFQLEKNGPRIFVNVPRAGHIAVIDRNQKKVIATWPVAEASANYPMALDEANHRLFTGCRKPPKVLVYDSESGKVVSRFDCPGDTDDLFFDAERRAIYVIGGEGAVAVFAQRDPDNYDPAGRIETAPGARTGWYSQDLRRLFVAVPRRGTKGAEIRIME